MTISPPFFPQLFPNIFCCPTVDWSWGGNFTDIVDVYAAWLSSSCPRVVPAQVTSERANFGQQRDPVPGIFEVIKDQGISPGKPHPCFWSRLFLMPKNSGSVAAAISQAQRRSNRVNRGCNGRDVQLDRLGDQLTAPTRTAKKRFAPDDGIQLEVNARAPLPKKRRTKVSPLTNLPNHVH